MFKEQAICIPYSSCSATNKRMSGPNYSIATECWPGLVQIQISSVTYGFQMKAIFTLMATSTDKQLVFVVQKPLHSAQVTIWCTVSRHRILDTYFVEDDAQNPLTVNQEHYREIIIAPFVQDLKHFCHARNCHCDNRGCSKMELQPTWQRSHLPVCIITLVIA